MHKIIKKYLLLNILLLWAIQITFSINLSDSLFKNLPNQKSLQRAEILVQISKEFRTVNADSSKLFAEEALMIAKQHNDLRCIAEAYNALGGAYIFKGDFNKAIDNLELALLNFKNLNDKERAADMMNNLGVVHRKAGKYDKAIRYYIDALSIKEKNKDKREIISLLNNIGSIYYYQKKFKKAEEYYVRALDLSFNLNDNIGVAAAYNNLSLIAFEQNDFKKSLELNKKSLELRKLNNDQYGVAVCLNNMGRIYQAENDFNQAIYYYLQAYERFIKTGDWDSAANSLFKVGTIYSEKKDCINALKYLEKSVFISDSIGATLNLKDNYKVMADCYKELGNIPKAYYYLREYVVLNDSIINEQSLRYTAELEAQYESGRKEAEIQLLKQEKLLQEKDNERQKAELNRQRILKNSLIAGLILVAIIVVLILFQFAQKQKANKLLKQQNDEINQQKRLIEQKSIELAEKNKEVTDSIRYAQRIQQAIFPSDNFFKSLLPESFVLFKPKDIVSGDFYWVQPGFLNNNFFYVAAVDCTGHGVPGAFMSIVGNNLLTEAVKVAGKVKPAEILDEVNKNLTLYLHQKSENSSIKDGMDIALCAIDKENKQLMFAGAYNHLYMIRNNELHIFNADKKPIGSWTHNDYIGYNEHLIQLFKGDVFYIFSDGYADQFGGPKGKKFKASQLRELLLTVHTQSFDKQKEILNQAFENWKGNLDQVDDVLLIGFKVF